MKVLVVGGGGREHALCWKLRQSPLISELYCAPGNPGIAEVADLVPIQAEEIHQLASFAGDLGIALTVVGPALPLSLGLAAEITTPRATARPPARCSPLPARRGRPPARPHPLLRRTSLRQQRRPRRRRAVPARRG